MQVAVYHNVAFDSLGRHRGFVEGYQVEHPVSLVFATELPAPDHEAACDQVWRMLNADPDPELGTDLDAVRYRQRGNRSLSVGDVIAVDGVFYACGARGWEELRDVPWIVRRIDVRGSAPLPDPVQTLPEYLAMFGAPGRVHPVFVAGTEADQWPSIVVRAGDKSAVIQVMNVGVGTDAQHLCLDVHAFTAAGPARASVFGIEDGYRVDGFADEDTAGTSHGWPAARLVTVLVGTQAETRAASEPSG